MPISVWSQCLSGTVGEGFVVLFFSSFLHPLFCFVITCTALQEVHLRKKKNVICIIWKNWKAKISLFLVNNVKKYMLFKLDLVTGACAIPKIISPLGSYMPVEYGQPSCFVRNRFKRDSLTNDLKAYLPLSTKHTIFCIYQDTFPYPFQSSWM